MGNNPSRFKDNPKNPVVCVSWDDAQEFCRKLKQITGKDFRLPTEAEWEYAWYNQNSDSKTHLVGQKKPNNWGLYDMSGNVWELCEDSWHDSYANKPENIKNNGNIKWSGGNKSCRSLRGGSWFGDLTGCRSAFRVSRIAGDGDLDIDIGFRIALGPF
jgi:formylglycine-generating enzyme required for sulfatase activity